MNGLYSDPDLRRALSQQNFERRFSESEKARLLKIASSEESVSTEIKGFNLGEKIKSLSGRIAQSTLYLLISPKAGNHTFKI